MSLLEKSTEDKTCVMHTLSHTHSYQVKYLLGWLIEFWITNCVVFKTRCKQVEAELYALKGPNFF